MFIETETTPNPATLKFLPGRDVLGTSTADYAHEAAATNSPLAQRLFALPGVTRVFLGGDFVTITKAEATGWTVLRPRILAALMDHFLSGLPAVEHGATDTPPEDTDAADTEIVTQIKLLLDERVRPAVAADGGDIVFRGYRDGVVKLHMQGACSGCPSSRATLKHGIENMLRHYLPEVVSVEQVDL